jgi:hypothetical protein
MMQKNRRRWAEYYDLPEIKKIRKKILDNYSNKLQFIEETHQYFLDGVEYTCVSDIIKRWENNDREAMLEGCAKKAQWKKDYKYYGMSKDEIRELWDKNAKEACDFGTLVHGFGESMFYWIIGEDDKILPEYKEQFAGDEPVAKNKHEEAVIQFWKDIPDCFVPVLAETKVFNQEGTPYAGTFDILFYYYKGKNDPKNGLVVFDYKTNKDLSNDYCRDTGKMMKAPFDDLVEESLSHYQLQLSLYSIPIEKLGLKVIGRRVIWLLPDGSYEKIKMKDEVGRLRFALKINS